MVPMTIQGPKPTVKIFIFMIFSFYSEIKFPLEIRIEPLVTNN